MECEHHLLVHFATIHSRGYFSMGLSEHGEFIPQMAPSKVGGIVLEDTPIISGVTGEFFHDELKQSWKFDHVVKTMS